MVNTGLYTLDDDLTRYTLLRPMDHPVNDPMNNGHFVPASKTAAFIANKNLNFTVLKKELLNTDKNRFQATRDKVDAEADAITGGLDLFKGQKIWDVVECNI